MKTLKQISAESGLSKSAVRKRAKKAGVLDQLTNINGTFYADQDQEQKILEGLTIANVSQEAETEPTRAADPEAGEEPTKGKSNASDGPKSVQEDNAVMVLNEYLLDQISKKDALIQSLTDQLKEANELNRGLLQSLQYEQAKNKQIATATDQPKQETAAPEKQEPVKQTLWQKLFGK